MSWKATDTLPDGSQVAFITDDSPATPGFTIVENENGDIFEVPNLTLTEIR